MDARQRRSKSALTKLHEHAGSLPPSAHLCLTDRVPRMVSPMLCPGSSACLSMSLLLTPFCLRAVWWGPLTGVSRVVSGELQLGLRFLRGVQWVIYLCLTRSTLPSYNGVTLPNSCVILVLQFSQFRIDFKVLLLVYKSLNGLGPKYIVDMLTEYNPNRPLRSV